MVVGNLGKQIILISTHAEATPQTEEMSVNVFLECREYFKIYILKNLRNQNIYWLALEGASRPSSKLIVNMFSLCTS